MRVANELNLGCPATTTRDMPWQVQGSMSSLTGIVAGGGWFEVLWNLECPVGLNQREICAHFNEGNVAQFRRSTDK